MSVLAVSPSTGRSASSGMPARPRPRLRIAAVMDAPGISGPGRQLAALAGQLENQGVEFLIVLFQRKGRPAPAYAGLLELAGVRHVVLRESGPLDVTLPFRVARVLSAFRPDVVQSHIYRATALCALLRVCGARWPWVAFFHGETAENAKTRLYHAVDRRLLRLADRVVVMSDVEARRLAASGLASCVLHNAVLPVAKGAEPTSLMITGARPRIGVVGRLSPEKGVDVFLAACALLRRNGVTVSAVIAGDGPERHTLEVLCSSLGLSGHVKFLGNVDPIEPIYMEVDLLVIPSRSEGLPNVLLEALRADLPVVATNVGAVPEVIGGTSAGVIVPPESPEALARAIAEALGERGNPLNSVARRTVAARFSIERRAQAHLDLYRALRAESAS